MYVMHSDIYVQRHIQRYDNTTGLSSLFLFCAREVSTLDAYRILFTKRQVSYPVSCRVSTNTDMINTKYYCATKKFSW